MRNVLRLPWVALSKAASTSSSLFSSAATSIDFSIDSPCFVRIMISESCRSIVGNLGWHGSTMERFIARIDSLGADEASRSRTTVGTASGGGPMPEFQCRRDGAARAAATDEAYGH